MNERKQGEKVTRTLGRLGARYVPDCAERAPALTLKGWRQTILTAENPHGVHRSLEDAFDDFAWSAAA